MHLNIRDLSSHSGQVRHTEDMVVGHLFQGESDVTRVEPLRVDVRAMTDSGIVDVSGP